MNAIDTLQQWNQQLEAVVKRQAMNLAQHNETYSPEVMAQKSAGKNGLEVMTLLLEGHLQPPRISKTLDFYLVEVGDGLAIFQGTPDIKHFNPPGHGARGLVRHVARFGLGLLYSHQVTAGQGLHDVTN